MYERRNKCNVSRLKIKLPPSSSPSSSDREQDSDGEEQKQSRTERRLAEIAGDIALSQSCIHLLRNPTVFNFSRLRSRLKSDNRRWMTVFLKQNGLELLFECLEALGLYSGTFSNLVQRLECVMCIKMVMNSQIGLQSLISAGIYGKKFGTGNLTKYDRPAQRILVARQLLRIRSRVML